MADEEAQQQQQQQEAGYVHREGACGVRCCGTACCHEHHSLYV